MAAADRIHLSVRAGRSLAMTVRVPTGDPAPNDEQDLSDYTAKLRVLDGRNRTRRVLLSAEESPDATALLRRVSQGQWSVFFGKSYTAWLPFVCHVEMELQSSTRAEEVLPLVSAILHVTPNSVPAP